MYYKVKKNKDENVNKFNSEENLEVNVDKKKKKIKKVQYRINSKGNKRKIIFSVPLVSFSVFILLIYLLTGEIYSSYYEVDMNDVIRNFDIQLSTNVMTQMTYNSFQYEIDNLKNLEANSKINGYVNKRRDAVSDSTFDYTKNDDYDEVDDYFGLIKKRKENTSNKSNNDGIIKNNYVTSSGEKYYIIANLKIPSLNIEYPVLSSTSEELLKISITKYWGADPNEVGNMVILGHNYESQKFFSKLNNISNGAKIYLTDLSNKTLEYTVYDTKIIDPNDNSCTSQLTDGKTELTLITCYNRDKNRFVVKARAN